MAQPPPSTPPTSTTRFPPLATPTSAPKHTGPYQSTSTSTATSPPWPISPAKRSSPFKNDDETKQKRLKAIRDAFSNPSTCNNTTNLDTEGPTPSQPESPQLKGFVNARPPETPQSARVMRTPQSIPGAKKTPESPTASSSTVNARESERRSFTPTPTSSTLIPNRANASTTYKLSDLGLDLSGPRPFVDRNRSSSAGLRYHPQDSRHEEEDSKSEEELWTAFTPSSSAEQVADSLLGIQDEGKGKQKASHEDDEVTWWKVCLHLFFPLYSDY